MPQKINTDTFDQYIYEKFPDVFRQEDKTVYLALRRYIQSLNFGFRQIIDDIDNLWDCLDPIKCPAHLFPTLYECFGLPYFEDIPDSYQRKILTLIGELYMRKGTKGALQFLAKEVSGFDAEVIEKKKNYFKTWDQRFLQSQNFIPGVLSPSVTYADAPRLVDFGSWYTNRDDVKAGEVYITLTASAEDAELAINEDVLRRFLFFFMPFDIYWSILTRYIYEEEIPICEVLRDDRSWDRFMLWSLDREEKVFTSEENRAWNIFNYHNRESSKLLTNKGCQLNNYEYRLNETFFLNAFRDCEKWWDTGIIDWETDFSDTVDLGTDDSSWDIVEVVTKDREALNVADEVYGSVIDGVEIDTVQLRYKDFGTVPVITYENIQPDVIFGPYELLGLLIASVSGQYYRYNWTASSLPLFDSEYANAQNIYANSNLPLSDYTAARLSLQAAIDQLVKATFKLVIKSMLGKIGKLIYMGDLTGYYTYDGIGTIRPRASSNTAVCNILEITPGTWVLVPLKTGIAVLSFEITGTNLWEGAFAINVST